MKKQPKFEKGDVVLIEYKPIDPTINKMKEDDFTLGIILITGKTYYVDNGSHLFWPRECLTLISKGDFK